MGSQGAAPRVGPRLPQCSVLIPRTVRGSRGGDSRGQPYRATLGQRSQRRSPRRPRLLGSPGAIAAPAEPFPHQSWLLGASPPPSPAHCPIMHAILQATAEMSAAPRPLPSSDWMKVMSQPGVSCRTVAWKRSLKLRGEEEGLGLGGSRVRVRVVVRVRLGLWLGVGLWSQLGLG